MRKKILLLCLLLILLLTACSQPSPSADNGEKPQIGEDWLTAERNDEHIDTMSPGTYSLRSIDVALGDTIVWQYDVEEYAYQYASKVYASNLITNKQHELADIGSAKVIWGERNLFVTAQDKHDALTMWYQGQSTPVSGQFHFVPDWENNKFYYLSKTDEQNSIYVTNLTPLVEMKLVTAREGNIITCFALSPNKQGLLFVETTKPTDDPNEEPGEWVFIVDLVSGKVQEITGLEREAWIRHEQAVWLADDLIAFGYCRLMAGSDEQTLSFHTLSGNKLSLKRGTKLNSGLFEPDGKGIFLNDFDHSDGFVPGSPANIWHYDVVHDELQQLTHKAEWPIQQDGALAYNPERQLLFIRRFKGYTLAHEYDRQLLHGVLIDKQGREYTLFKLRDDHFHHAIWIGNRLLVQTGDCIFVYDFTSPGDSPKGV